MSDLRHDHSRVEFSKEDHDKLIHLDVLVREHERQLRMINGRLDGIHMNLARIKDNDLAHIRDAVSDVRQVASSNTATVRAWGSVIMAGLSGLAAIVVWAITQG